MMEVYNICEDSIQQEETGSGCAGQVHIASRKPSLMSRFQPDAKLRVQTRAEISKLHKNLGTTFIYVTHDQTEAMTMATRIAVMNKGKLQQLDTPQMLYDHPANLFVAGFIGSPAMNFFNGKLVEEEGGMVADMGTFKVRIPDKDRERYQGVWQGHHLRHPPGGYPHPMYAPLAS